MTRFPLIVAFVAIAASLLTLNTGASSQLVASSFRPVFLIIGILPILATAGFLRLAPESGSHVSGHRGRASPLAAD